MAEQDTGGLTLTIVGGERWNVPQSESDRVRMASYVSRAAVPSRCATCAFREGTPANRSQLVLHMIERCLLSHDSTFMCHTGIGDAEDSTRPCAGYVALLGSFAAASPTGEQPNG